MKNFDSVPQLQRFSYVHHCAARSRHDSHFTAMWPLASAKAISSSVAMQASQSWLRCTGPAASGPERVQNPWCGLWRMVLTEQWIESNRTYSFVTLNWIESFSFLPNHPSLVYTNNLKFSIFPISFTRYWMPDNTQFNFCCNISVIYLYLGSKSNSEEHVYPITRLEFLQVNIFIDMMTFYVIT